MDIADAAVSLVNNGINQVISGANRAIDRKRYLQDREHEEQLYNERLAHEEERQDSIWQRDTDESWRVRDWQASREDSAYQRATSDMLAAGLNPNSMSGAAQSDAAAPVSTQQRGNPPAATAPHHPTPQASFDMVRDFVSLQNMRADKNLKEADADNKRAQSLTEHILRMKKAGLIDSEQAKNLAEASLGEEKAKTEQKRREEIDATIDHMNASIDKLRSDINLNESKGRLLFEQRLTEQLKQVTQRFTNAHLESDRNQRIIQAWVSLGVQVVSAAAQVYFSSKFGGMLKLGKLGMPPRDMNKNIQELNKPQPSRPSPGGTMFDPYDFLGDIPLSYE